MGFGFLSLRLGKVFSVRSLVLGDLTDDLLQNFDLGNPDAIVYVVFALDARRTRFTILFRLRFGIRGQVATDKGRVLIARVP